jgi:hypothetical protein
MGELLKAIANCKKQTKDVKAFLDNVDKMAQIKMENCSKGCVKSYLRESDDQNKQVNRS